MDVIQSPTTEKAFTGKGWEGLATRTLALLFALMLSGGLQAIANISRAGLWICLLSMWAIVLLVGYTLPIRRLIFPAMPFLVWMVCYWIWGTIVSPINVNQLALKLAFYFSLILGTVLILSSDRERLAIFASYIQWALVLNLLVALLLVSRPEYGRYLAASGSINPADKIINSDRFAGLWGNANQAGFAALIMLVLSAWAKPVTGWIGRISAITIVFLTASRQSTWLLILISLLFLVMVVGRSAKGRMIGAFLALAIGVSVPFVDAALVGGLSQDPRIARVMDFSEKETRARGGVSRFQWLAAWMPTLYNGPWYGHGLAAMAGSDTPMTEFRTDVPYLGIHNLYFGLWADVGVLGLITFLGVVGWQVLKTLRRRYTPITQWGLVSLIVVVLVDSFVKHSMLFDMEGMAAYLIIFLLPTSRALTNSGELISNR